MSVEIFALVGLLLLIAGICAYFFTRSSKGSDIVFVGLQQAGKTTLISKLLNSEKDFLTATSIGANIAAYKLEDSKTIQLIDIPGADRLRYNAIQKFKSSVRGIILVINSEKVQKEIRDVAELLFSLLTDEKINSLKPKILIAANQQDCPIAKSGVKIQELLENELTLVRKTQGAALRDTNDDERVSVYLGKKNSDSFKFADLPMKVEVHECSGKEGNLDAVRSWIQSCA
ncbi:Oidioi.mRNA.OKI2018_I69.chr2.g4033.t1.cds [Oikopleura dioica]|uniref:Signal recognition particle receptor subunit beta n=1 Tax=Oikopleura dioica TaxID=34765 RepID=A0ABN7T2R5_OIKDI|nr:Oidioi.mRNA.OKI2018_I69.chr2.g4033.t1.cds [Oikopleura dioica]